MQEAESVWRGILKELREVRRVVQTLKTSGEKIRGLEPLRGSRKGVGASKGWLQSQEFVKRLRGVLGVPRAAKNSLGVECPHSTGVLGKEGEVGPPSGAGEGGGVSKGLDMGPGYFSEAERCLVEKGIQGG